MPTVMLTCAMLPDLRVTPASHVAPGRRVRPRRRGDRTASGAAWRLALGLLCCLGATAVQTGETQAIDGARASALKSQYPFVRFSSLTADASIDVPLHSRPPPIRPAAGHGAPLVPAGAWQLNGRRISVRGYMVPLVVDARGVRSFILSSSIDSCHFGLLGGMTDWIEIRLTDRAAVPPAGLSPVTVFGTLSVGEAVRRGSVTSLYRMTADFVAIHH